jgi:molybdate transport system substrate-binding protein
MTFRVLSVILLLVLGLSCQRAENGELTIATAANMQYAMAELMDAFTAQSGYPCHMVVGSSGKLTAQILEGAPYDVFVSADIKYPEVLTDAGITLGRPIVYAEGGLVLWSADLKNVTWELLSDPDIQHIAIPNPETAPYGRATKELLISRQLWDTLLPKLVYGESVAQTNQFIASGAATMGFTSESTVMAPINKNRGSWVALDNGNYQPIEQAMVLMTSTPEKEAQAKAFRDFIKSAQGKEILLKFGFTIPHE